MASASTIAALQTMYKTIYHNRDLSNQSKRKTAAYDQVAKYDDFDGAQLVFPFNYNMPVGVSPSFALGQASPKASGFANWTMTTRKTLYGFLTIDAQAMKAARKDIGAFLRLRQKETNEILSYMKMVLGGHAFWGDGAGDMAQVTAITGTNPVTEIVVNQRDVIKFHLNQRIVFNATRTGSSGGIKASVYTVTSLNRLTGAIGISRASGSGAGTDPAANDYVYLEGSYDAFPLGVAAFIPATDPGVSGVPTSLLGMTRTDDPVMKAGWRVDWQGSIEETAKYLTALMGQYFDKESSVLWLSRFNWHRLEMELSAQGRKVIDARATQVFGSPALLLLTPEGEIPVVADNYLGDDVAFLLDMSAIEVHHLDNLIHIVDDDGMSLVRQTADDGVEIRFRSWSENIIQRPFKCGRFPIPALS
jgi:hypothetical protein